jgi:hypothetical protein
MRVPRIQFTIQWLMAVVAVGAILSLLAAGLFNPIPYPVYWCPQFGPIDPSPKLSSYHDPYDADREPDPPE